MVAGKEQFMHPGFKPDCPVKGLHRMAAPGIRLQIVYKIAVYCPT